MICPICNTNLPRKSTKKYAKLSRYMNGYAHKKCVIFLELKAKIAKAAGH